MDGCNIPQKRIIWKKICKTKAKAWKTFQLEVFEQSAILSATAECRGLRGTSCCAMNFTKTFWDKELYLHHPFSLQYGQWCHQTLHRGKSNASWGCLLQIRIILGKDETWVWKPKVCQNLRNVWKWHYARCKISCWPKRLGQKHLWTNSHLAAARFPGHL